MGKNSRNNWRSRRENKGGQGSGSKGADTRGDAYVSIPTENEKYEKFYKESGLIPEEEWEEFWSTLKRTLPTTFRFTGSKGNALNVLKTLQEIHVPHLSGIIWEDQPVAPPTPLPWFPDNLAWQMTAGKAVIRRCAPFKKFQNFLVAETTVGNISRQEAVSMIPPLLMDIEPHHTVLDMCAAPGSKTAQLIEAIHAGEEARVEAAVAQGDTVPGGSSDSGGRPTGLVIANDADYRRSHMLIHQTKRLNSPNLIVTNHDATWFPSIRVKEENGTVEYLKFDRILADVPCTGDGTPRKNYGVWRDWTPNGAFGLHLTQVRILVRGLQMLKVGGRIVYSTCSMNPVENEAVLAAAIDRCGGVEKVNIVDVSDRLPELKRRPGVSEWRVCDKDGAWFSTWEEVENDEKSMERMSRMTREMFPTENKKSLDDPTKIPLERAIRVYPHLQDTGGFFITVLEKKQEIRAIKPEAGGRKKMAAIAKAQAEKELDEDAASENHEAAEGTEIAAGETSTPVTPAVVEESVPSEAPESPTKRKIETVDAAPPTPPAAKKTRLEGTAEAEPKGEASEPWGSKKTGQKTETKQENAPQKVGRKNGGQPIEEPFKYLSPEHSVIKQVFDFYGLSPRFPRDCFLVRNAEGIPSRAIYFTCNLAKTILTMNEGKNIKFIHCGVKAFFKQDVQEPDVCPWRIQNEGLPIIEGWIGEGRVVRAKQKSTVKGLLKELFPKVNAEGYEGDASTIAEIEEQVRNLSMGCCVLKVEKGTGEESFPDPLVLPLWKSRHSCNLMLPKDERKAMLMRLFNDEGEIIDSTNKNKHSQKKPDTSVDTEMAEAEGKGEGYGEEEPGMGEPVPMSVFEEPTSKVLEEDDVKEIVKEKEDKREVGILKEEVLQGSEEEAAEKMVTEEIVKEELGNAAV
ncbi:S-adenosyl-L-methionine-dependent methyltransferase [Morchella snyderi]|nr:S-adenosyl-L-methionine-dependent methyltransferase [Morchella snyderi]